MNKMVVVWVAIVALLTLKSFQRPAYAVGLYMMTFFVHPSFWWWGDIVEGYRWNLFAGILLLATLVMTKDTGPPLLQPPTRTNAARILLFMAINAIIVHLLVAANPDSSFGWLVIRMKFILLFFMLQYAIRDETDFRIVGMAIALGIGYIGYEATVNDRGHFNGGRLEGIGAAGVQSANQLASLLVTAVPLATTVMFATAKKWHKGVVILCCALSFNVILLCNSRGAFLGVLAAGVIFMVMATGPAKKQATKVLGLALLGTFLLLGDPEIIQRFMTTFSADTERDSSAQSRIIFWSAAGRMLADHPYGSGGNSFSEGIGWKYMHGGVEPGDTRAIHNGFITEATDWGVQGIAIALLFILAVWRTSWKGRKLAIAAGDANGVMIFACISASLTAWAVSSIFGDYLNDEWGFWTAAIAYAYLRLYMTQAAAKAVPAPAPVVHTGVVLQPAHRSFAS